MKFFGISYRDVMNMPVAAMNECIRFLDENVKPDKKGGGALGSHGIGTKIKNPLRSTG
jgi:hypothetical protein